MVDMTLFTPAVRIPPPSGAVGVPLRPMRRRLTLLPVVMITFFIVSGGAFGLEPLISASGPGMALLLIVVTPFIWAIPTALVVAELSSALPVEGGYYLWVKKALGSFWGFQEGWWSWLSTFVDMAIYPVLFVTYLSALLEQQLGTSILAENFWLRWGVMLLVIWVFTALNVRGARPVGWSSVLFGVLVLAPFVVLSGIGLARLWQSPVAVWEPVTPPDSSLLGAFGVGLFVVMWNYQGWDSISTVAGEVTRPRRTLPLSLVLAVPLIILAYLIPTVAGLTGDLPWTDWTDGAFPQIAASVGGEWLGLWLALAGVVSAAALFSANLLSNSRLPFVMAQDGYLPGWLVALHPRYGTPWISIIVCAVIYSIFTLETFSTLVVIDVVLYAAALFLEIAALIVLRLEAPELHRPFRVPGGWPGVALVTVLPVVVLALAVVSTYQEDGVEALYLSGAALASGVVLYPLLRVLVKRRRPDVDASLGASGEADGDAAGADSPGYDGAYPVLEDSGNWMERRLARSIPSSRPRWRR